jgi:hypothetical protein
VLLVTGPFVDKLLTKRDVFAFSYTTQVVVSTLGTIDVGSPDRPIAALSV